MFKEAIEKTMKMINSLNTQEREGLLAETRTRLGDRAGLCSGCKQCVNGGQVFAGSYNEDGEVEVDRHISGERCLAGIITMIKNRDRVHACGE